MKINQKPMYSLGTCILGEAVMNYVWLQVFIANKDRVESKLII